MRAVIIDTNTGLVINVIELDEEADYTAPTGHTVQYSDTAQIGWSWNGSAFIAPIEPSPPVIVPTQISTRQFLIAAAIAGIITQQEAVDAAMTGAVPAAIEAVFGALPNEEQFAARITWAKMTVIPRDDHLVRVVATSLNMTEQQMDDFFISAGNIP